MTLLRGPTYVSANGEDSNFKKLRDGPSSPGAAFGILVVALLSSGEGVPNVRVVEVYVDVPSGY